MEGSGAFSSGDDTHSQITTTETDQDTAGEAEPMEKAASVMKRRRSSVRKPRTKGLVKKLQDQVSECVLRDHALMRAGSSETNCFTALLLLGWRFWAFFRLQMRFMLSSPHRLLASCRRIQILLRLE